MRPSGPGEKVPVPTVSRVKVTGRILPPLAFCHELGQRKKLLLFYYQTKPVRTKEDIHLLFVSTLLLRGVNFYMLWN